MMTELDQIFPATLERLAGVDLETLNRQIHRPEDLPGLLRGSAKSACAEVPYLAELASLELALHRVRTGAQDFSVEIVRTGVNPSLELLQVGWAPLLAVLAGEETQLQAVTQYLLLWRDPGSGRVRAEPAAPGDLLALKVVLEEHDPREIAASQGQPVGQVDRVLERAVAKGLLLEPETKLRRNERDFPLADTTPHQFIAAEAFTLQWHITHRCDLHCRHCYDRSLQEDIAYQQGIAVLDQLREFCLQHHVYGQVSFSGGNPFLHPRFYDLYRAAGERNLSQAVLGNPVSESQLDALLKINKPVFYQVSLEGLQAHNDHIRGAGNFSAVLDFLDLLKRRKIYSMVMLTLTQDNMDQVLPLAEILRDRVDLFTYNRLSMVGEGAVLESPRAGDYQAFVKDYLRASQANPVIALKDNLLNIERDRQGNGWFGGCTGFGCGAAFNFFSLLPNGEVHACRKFPSPIGTIHLNSLTEIYYSDRAAAYRKGSAACEDCRLRPVCGGCLAVTYGCGLDPLREKDPACFMS